MSRLSCEILKTGFIRDLYLHTLSNCKTEQVNNYSNLANNFDRYGFVSKIANANEFQLDGIKQQDKNHKMAFLLKQRGNDAFQKKNWQKSGEYYNASLLLLPSYDDEDFAILLANRSAAMYHLEEYDHALMDIELAEKYYPGDMMYKLKERKARCFLAKKYYEKALKAFQETITALDNSKLPFEKRQKLERDAQIMVKMLPRQIEAERKMKNSKIQNKTNDEIKSKRSDAFEIDFSVNTGRFAKARRPIKAAEEILVEKAHCLTLFEKFAKTHCQNCITRTKNPLPCPKCVDVVFCSTKCREEALSTYHQHECGILDIVWKSGASINCRMALRIITQIPLSKFKEIKDDLMDDLSFDKVANLPTSDYRRIYALVSHEDKAKVHNSFQYAFMAVFLTELVKKKGYFGEKPIDEDVTFIGGLMLHNLQLLQYNSHEVFDFLKSKQNNARQTVEIGAGLFPTLALFNHSCNPGIVRYFKKNYVCVNSIRGIKTGEMIAENYGPLYSENPKSERQTKMKEAYCFECNCEACEQNWPTFNEMNNTEIRFKCNGNKNCDNVIIIPSDCNEFMIQCIKCGEYTNILKGLKAVQDTEMLDKVAKRLFKEGNVDKALEKYKEMMNILEENLVAPFQDYVKCQMAITNCFLEYGNCVEVD